MSAQPTISLLYQCPHLRSYPPYWSVISISSTTIFYLLTPVCFSNLPISFSSSHNLQCSSSPTLFISQGLNPTIFIDHVFQSSSTINTFLLSFAHLMLLTCFVTFVPLSSTLWRFIWDLNLQPLNPEVMLKSGSEPDIYC